MRPFRLPLLLLLLCLTALPLVAEVTPVPGGIVRATIASKALAQERTILVRVPSNYERTDAKYPVLFVLDADQHMNHTVATVEFLARNIRVPEMIVVGIVVPDPERDLTPTVGRDHGPNIPVIPNAGGAGRFLDYLQRDVIPWVEKNYRTSRYRVLSGHWLGGLFTTYALYTRPSLFHSYIAVSPAFTWDNGWIVNNLEAAVKKNPKLTASLYFAVGEEGPVMDRDYNAFRNALAKSAPRTLDWSSGYFKGEEHGTVPMLAHYSGLQKIFAKWEFPFTLARDETPQLQAVEDHYARVSARVGFPVRPPEALLNVIGYRRLEAGENELAIEVFRRNVELYPASANAHDSLGEAYEKAGQLPLAVDAYARAVQVGKKNDDPNAATFETNLARVQKALLAK